MLVIGAELLSRYLDYKDRATCVIFGDGVAAAVFGPVEPPSGILAHELHTEGQYADHLFIPAGGTAMPASCQTVEQGAHYIKMRGNELFKVAVRSLEDVSRQVLKKAGLTTDDIDLFIPAPGEPAHYGSGARTAGVELGEGLFQYLPHREYLFGLHSHLSG